MSGPSQYTQWSSQKPATSAGPEGPSRVHRGARQRHADEVVYQHGQADSDRRQIGHAPLVHRRGEHGEHQNEREHRLHQDARSHTVQHLQVQGVSAQVTLELADHRRLHKKGADNRARELRGDVEYAGAQLHTTCDHGDERHRRVDVTTGNLGRARYQQSDR